MKTKPKLSRVLAWCWKSKGKPFLQKDWSVVPWRPKPDQDLIYGDPSRREWKDGYVPVLITELPTKRRKK